MPISFSSNQTLATPCVYVQESTKKTHAEFVLFDMDALYFLLLLVRWTLTNYTLPARTSVLWNRFSECFSVNTSVSSPGSSLFFLASTSGLSSLSISSGDCSTETKTEQPLQTGTLQVCTVAVGRRQPQNFGGPTHVLHSTDSHSTWIVF